MMQRLCPLGSHLGRAAVAWPQVTAGRRRSYRVSTVAMAKVWRPGMNDVDRLSRGDGAKKRGTGNFNIPHRLNSDERPVYEAAKKKGYLQVRGTGYRKGRKGNPLPNVYRQWCDAKAQPCIVIEQDMTGSSTDCVVVDLSTLRVTDLRPALQACHELAAAAGARHVPPAERALEAVPFNVIPVGLPQSVRQMLYPEDSTPSAAAAAAAAATPEQISAAEQAVLQQADLIRQLKAAGQGNSDPEVQKQVQALLQLKVELQQLLESAAEVEEFPAYKDGDSSSLRLAGSSEISDNSTADEEEELLADVSTISSSARQEVFDEDHPFVNLAIWQLPVLPLFFEADRTAAKALAKNMSSALAAAVARR